MFEEIKENFDFLKMRPAGTKGPASSQWLATQKLFFEDQIRFFKIMKGRYGDTYWYRLANIPFYAIHDPEVIETLLLKNNANLKKDVITHSLDDLLGIGLLTNEGESWKKQRKLASPSLSPKQIRSYATTMTDYTRDAVSTWKDGQVIHTQKEMMALTLRIVMKTLLGIDQLDIAKEAGKAIDDTMESFAKEHHTAWTMVPKFVNAPHRKTFQASIQILDKIIYDVINTRRKEDGDSDDLLNRFMISKDEDGNAMSDKQLRDEAITMFLAGHETTALSITYMLLLLAKNPDTLRRAQTEIDEIIGEEIPNMEHTKELIYLEAFANEAMRLYPPAWLIAREITDDFDIDGITYKKGHQVGIPICAIHHDSRWYKNPLKFNPSRWLDGSLDNNPRFAFIPFGGGARLCIGKHFAMMEMLLVVSTILQKYSVKDVTKDELVLEPAITLRPITPIHLELTARS